MTCIIILVAALAVSATADGFVASDSKILLNPPCYDSKSPECQQNPQGDLLPAVSYSEFIDRGMKFLLEDQETWYKGESITDESGQALPPYFRHAKLRPDGKPYSKPTIDRGVVYPAFHHAIAIQAFLRYFLYSGNEEALHRARQLADWNISHSTLKSWPYGSLPYSTFSNGVPGGFVDGDAIMTDKPAMMGLAYLDLHRATGEAPYLEAAVRIADTLAKNQTTNGDWPFRVNPKTGEVREAYTSSAIYAVMLFEALDRVGAGQPYLQHHDRALQWVLDNPVRTMDWRGFYEDVGNSPENRTNWDCIDTARYLLVHRDDLPQALAKAKHLNQWIEETFVDRHHLYAPAPGVREQKVCFSIMGGHGMHWAMMLADLYHVTGDARLRRDIVQVMNFMTYHLQPNNRVIVGPKHGLKHPEGAPYWFSTQFSSIFFFLELFHEIPELAPNGQSHLLYTTGRVRNIRYVDNMVTYVTDGSSEDILKLAFVPREIAFNGKKIPANTQVWTFNLDTHICVIHNAQGKVNIKGQER